MQQNPLRQDFPIFSARQNAEEDSYAPWVYFDSAATSQKPQAVIDAITDYYLNYNSNVHRASHSVAAKATAKFEQARNAVRNFINAPAAEQIVFTKGATESINLIAYCLSQRYFKAGDRILLSASEHHANIVPWQRIAEKMGLHLDVIPLKADGSWDLDIGLDLISDKTALVAVGHVSNAFGTINPITAVIDKAKQFGALTVIDGAQACPHIVVDVQSLNCDYYVFSGHKMFGPTGVGVLYGKRHLLDALPPYQLGGEMIKKVSFSGTSFEELPFKFEAGTPNIEGVIGLAAAVAYIEENRAEIHHQETQLYRHLLSKIKGIPGIQYWGDMRQSISTLAFTHEKINNQDLGILLNEQNIAVRVGHHCAMPLMDALGLDGAVRVSLSCYNTLEEVDRFIAALSNAFESAENELDEGSLIDDSNEQSTPASTGDLASRIQTAGGWDEMYRQIMLAGKQLKRIPEEQRVPNNEVFGCESQVWLTCRIKGQHLELFADSPSKIVRGLLAILFEEMETKTIPQLNEFDVEAYLKELGLAKHLSQSRGNGLQAVVDKIQTFSKRLSNFTLK